MGPVTGEIRTCGLEISVARRFWPRFVGLLGSAGLAPHQALLLLPCSNIHTCFMRFAIDVVFLSKDGTIVAIVRHLRPWRMAAARRAHACLELRAGAAAVLGLQPGQRIAELAAATLAAR